jgi:AraC-like DNA-binding protein
MSFTNFVNLYRLEAALELLENSNASILDIALSSGFQSVRNFNDFFRKNLNITPSQYRKASRN